jgi:hypothetical protein
MGAFAKSLILCGAEASCIEALTGLPKEVVAKLFKEAAVEREEEFKAGTRSLAERRQEKIPAQQPVKRQPYTGGLLWQKRQTEGLEASGCFATCGANSSGGERSWEDRRKNPPDRTAPLIFHTRDAGPYASNTWDGRAWPAPADTAPDRTTLS